MVFIVVRQNYLLATEVYPMQVLSEAEKLIPSIKERLAVSYAQVGLDENDYDISIVDAESLASYISAGYNG